LNAFFIKLCNIRYNRFIFILFLKKRAKIKKKLQEKIKKFFRIKKKQFRPH